MIFSDALNNMLLGKKLIRPAWSGYYATVLSNQSYIWLIASTGKTVEPNVQTYTPSVDDLQATDWVVKVN
jgi:hypothetical protein